MPFLKSIIQTENSTKYWKDLNLNAQDEKLILSGNIMIYSKKKSDLVIKQFQLQGTILSYINDKGIKKGRNIEFDIVKIIGQDPAESRYSLSLSCNSKQKVLIWTNIEEFHVWYEQIKKQCINTTFGEEYDFLALIGEGSTSKVYQIKSIKCKTLYACKIFDKKLLEKNPRFKKSIKSEVRILRGLRHDKIVQLNYVYEDEYRMYLILDFIEGQTIHNYLKINRRFHETQAKDIIHDILDILKYLQSHKVIHRDIKPRNIMLTKEKDKRFSIKIIDFAHATTVDYIDTKYICGTHDFIVLKEYNQKEYDAKVDIFSLGIMLYTMISGKKPFSVPNVEDIIQLNKMPILNFDDWIWKYISKDAQNLIKQMTAKDPNYRISCQEALFNPWFAEKFIEM